MIPGGKLGLRKLVSAFAEVHLRKRGYGEKPDKRANRRGGRGRIWTDGEIDTASLMEFRGFRPAQIGKALGRTSTSVTRQLNQI